MPTSGTSDSVGQTIAEPIQRRKNKKSYASFLFFVFLVVVVVTSSLPTFLKKQTSRPLSFCYVSYSMKRSRYNYYKKESKLTARCWKNKIEWKVSNIHKKAKRERVQERGGHRRYSGRREVSGTVSFRGGPTPFGVSFGPAVEACRRRRSQTSRRDCSFRSHSSALPLFSARGLQENPQSPPRNACFTLRRCRSERRSESILPQSGLRGWRAF